MIVSILEFRPEALRSVLAAVFTLPDEIRPTHQSVDEEDAGELIHDYTGPIDALAKKTSGFFLKGPRVLYDISLAGREPIICNCFLDVEPGLAEQFLKHMADARPMFGFACAQEERYLRNRVTIKQGVNTIEGWVGRDTRKYVPGFYWLTLLPEALAKQHGVPLNVVGKIAKEHIELQGGQHLFRFYDRPDDWHTTPALTELYASSPGVFDIEKVRPQLMAAKTFLELDAVLRSWK